MKGGKLLQLCIRPLQLRTLQWPDLSLTHQRLRNSTPINITLHFFRLFIRFSRYTLSNNLLTKYRSCRNNSCHRYRSTCNSHHFCRIHIRKCHSNRCNLRCRNSSSNSNPCQIMVALSQTCQSTQTTKLPHLSPTLP